MMTLKKITCLFVFVLILFSLNAQVNTWTQKADFGGTAEYGAVGFSIGEKGYVGTGAFGEFPQSDFWEYDPVTDSWTQKADFGGEARQQAVGFSIGSKGYIGTGLDYYNGGTLYKDFWEYDPATNSWTQKADFGGKARFSAVGFSVDSKGYLGTGEGYNETLSDFWEYDPETDHWTKKADFQGQDRSEAVGFSIDSKGYVGTGEGYDGTLSDFWEYDPTSDHWTKKADLLGERRGEAVGFFIDSKGYIGSGKSYNGLLSDFRDYDPKLSDFWEYDPTSDHWTQKADFGGGPVYEAVGFSIGNKGYIGTGIGEGGYDKDFWEYTDTSACITPSNLTNGNITSTSANLKWGAVSGAGKYKLRYEIAGTNNWITDYPVAHHKVITDLLPNTKYTWQVKTICQADSPSITSVWSSKQHFNTLTRLSNELADQVAFQLYPNPAKSYTAVQFTLIQSSHVIVIVCDVSGKEIETIMDNKLQEGDYSFQFNTSNFSKGVYVVTMVTDFGTENRKLVVE